MLAYMLSQLPGHLARLDLPVHLLEVLRATGGLTVDRVLQPLQGSLEVFGVLLARPGPLLVPTPLPAGSVSGVAARRC
jgi:hypothetical protein